MPHRLPVFLIDAFTETPLTGNACLVVLNADGLSDEQMQAIARETNLPETAFLLSSSAAQFRARYFTPAEEIPLAGHPTLAVARALVDAGYLSAQASSFSLQLEAGVIQVEISQSAAGLRFTMVQPSPRFGRTYNRDTIAPVFGLHVDDILSTSPIQTVSTGTPQLMIPLRDLDALRRVQLNITDYNALKQQGDFFSPHLFAMPGISEDAATFARHFGTPPDVYEDPFTGSATGGMAAYLWRYGLLESARFIAEQGHWMQRPGRAYVEVIGEREHIAGVKVGGHAVRVMTGELTM